jgi:hypothetical protein
MENKPLTPYDRRGLDRLLDEIMSREPHTTAIWQYHNDPIFHAVVKHILQTCRDGRFSITKWWQALELASAFSAPQAPETPGTTPEAETPRKTAPGGRETGKKPSPRLAEAIARHQRARSGPIEELVSAYHAMEDARRAEERARELEDPERFDGMG